MNECLSKIRVCHLTSVHPAKDGRIFYKECTSLANAGYDVTLVVAGAEDEICNGVKIVGVPKSEGRLGRMFVTTRNVYKKAIQIDADVYHLHDPELIPIGLKLKRRGKKVMFDSHEDYTSNIKEKPYFQPWIAKSIAVLYAGYEKHSLRRFDGLISVTPHLTDRLKAINSKIYQITNYKKVYDKDLKTNKAMEKRLSSVAFVGPIRNQWCVKEIIESLSEDTSLMLAGPAEIDYLDQIKKLSNWAKVNYMGKVGPKDVEGIYKSCSLGFALLRYSLAVGNNMGTLGNTKIFEIMGAGVPVICTDFILWKNIIKKYKCGICINPTDITAIKDAVKFLLGNPEEAKRMGENGRKAVESEFNWESQEKILLEMYKDVLNL